MTPESRDARLPGVRLFVRPAHPDERGCFRRVFSESEYAPLGIADRFVEDNVSVSRRGVLRGMHYDFRLAKFVQVLDGAVFDAVVDVRRGSPTFGQWEAFELSAGGCEQLYVPRGFAHGFYVLSERAIVSYKQTAPYDPSSEGQLRWNDPAVGIAWPLAGEPAMSAKDRAAPLLSELP
ncbi:MAG TPA: dTDP-4-dehydrorhamnose 3,5-epimerase [Candidatus Acidoferrales bacterium]|nr:dTDP-4-dehydrorhamnose 3,5-epimerase [Candidatus Acidoferrales bacterium]